MSKYCALVIWFNPDNQVFKNVYSYIDDVEKLFIVDNSAENHIDIVKSYEFSDKCEYVFLGGNTGLAHALNVGCRKATEQGYDFVLTMDQDSLFEKNAVQLLKKYMEEHKEEYSIVCPNVKSLYLDDFSGKEKIAYIKWDTDVNEEQNWVMTSGSLMSLSDYNACGGFDDAMFIAHLDIDIGIKIHKMGKKVMMLGNAIIQQHFGNSKPKKLLWKTVHPSFASPVRTYYLFRNQKYLEYKYGKKIRGFIGVSLWKFVVKITFFEDQKIEKYKMMIRAYRDSTHGIMGEYKR